MFWAIILGTFVAKAGSIKFLFTACVGVFIIRALPFGVYLRAPFLQNSQQVQQQRATYVNTAWTSKPLLLNEDILAPTSHINIRILQTMISGIPLSLHWALEPDGEILMFVCFLLFCFGPWIWKDLEQRWLQQ